MTKSLRGHKRIRRRNIWRD